MTSQPPRFPHLVAEKWLRDGAAAVSEVEADQSKQPVVIIDPVDYEFYAARARRLRGAAASVLARSLGRIIRKVALGLVSACSVGATRLRGYRTRRITSAALAGLSPHMLKDIGLVPGDLIPVARGYITVGELNQVRRAGWHR